jgi:Protein of unknown function (DUF2795)
MNAQRVAEIQVVLEGVKLPATRDELVRYAEAQDAQAASELGWISDREYGRIDEVAEELLPTQPVPVAQRKPPRPESGQPPGGDDYLRPFPESGAVRPDAPRDNPPQKAIDKATETTKRQKAAQGG